MKTYKYKITHERNSLGEDRFSAKFVTPWYIPNTLVFSSDSACTYYFSTREEVMVAIISDATQRRILIKSNAAIKERNSYKIVVVEEVEV